MEKKTAHHRLAEVHDLISRGEVRATNSAFSGARDLGINNLDGMCDVVLALTYADFHKSMTTHNDHRIWQDVYHAKTPNGDSVYLKLNVIDDVVIISFKEL